MGFITTKFQAEFARRVLPNLTTLLERDTEAALLELDDTLPLFKSTRVPVVLTTNFPALFVNVERVQAAQADDDSYLQQEQRYSIDLAITGKDAFTLQQQMTDYVLVIDRVLRRASVQDLTGEPSAVLGRPAWEVTEHDYVLSQRDTILRADARLVLTLQILER